MHYHSKISRLLHWLALDNRHLARAFLNIELSQGECPERSTEKHIFVAGLARSGTTMVLRHLAKDPGLASFTYRDMPFVLMPSLWSKMSRWLNAKPMAPEERAHKDGIYVDANSPEALDEIYWRVTVGESYIRPPFLLAHTPDAAALEGYKQLVNSFLHLSGRNRYLSKGNNNILRLPALKQHFPNAVFVTPFRDPASQASSLHRQHLHFQSSDAFTRKYMSWLAHHEFGADHLRFHFSRNKPCYDAPESVNYWLELWLEVYRHLWETRNDGGTSTIFVCYETLCDAPHYWTQLAEKLEVASGMDNEYRLSSARSDERDMDQNLLREAREVYKNLCSLREIH